jgi:hypothetical protein
MHEYQADDEIRKRVFLLAAGLSVFFAYMLHLVVVSLKTEIPWWIDAPSVLGFYGILMWAYDNYLWNRSPVSSLPWFFIPDLNGKWDVEIKSSYHDFETTVKAHAAIRQTATKMSIGLKTDISSSYSTTASLMKTDRVSQYELIYHYINEPKADSEKTLNIHHGTSCMEFSDADRMEGDYFSGRGRVNYGKISFVRTRN